MGPKGSAGNHVQLIATVGKGQRLQPCLLFTVSILGHLLPLPLLLLVHLQPKLPLWNVHKFLLFCLSVKKITLYKITWQTQGLQIHYGFLYSATVDVKMDTSQEEENVPLPIRFCFLLIAYFLVQTILSNSASFCCYP